MLVEKARAGVAAVADWLDTHRFWPQRQTDQQVQTDVDHLRTLLALMRAVQQQEPEADPELVAEWKRTRYDTGYLKKCLNIYARQVAAIRQVLRERGEQDGNAG